MSYLTDRAADFSTVGGRSCFAEISRSGPLNNSASTNRKNGIPVVVDPLWNRYEMFYSSVSAVTNSAD